MRQRSMRFFLALLFTLCFITDQRPSTVQAADPVVHAILFYSPSCPHCHQVIQEVLPPLFDQYGDQLQMIGVDTTSPGGSTLFGAAIQRFAIPPDQQAVPMLIVGETILLGSLDIPEQFPGLIEKYIAEGGIDWPDIPGLKEALDASQAQETAASEQTGNPAAPTEGDDQPGPAPSPEAVQPVVSQPSPEATPAGLVLPPDSDLGIRERLAQDPEGNTLAIIVLAGMLLLLIGSIKLLRPGAPVVQLIRPSIWIPVLCIFGLVVAGYLAYVETTQAEAVCGPVGDCNTVQQSEYARLFGVLPIGVLGLTGYIAILVAWGIAHYGSKRPARFASLALLGMTLFGILFSMYLTFLEPFVIGATCAWCLTSAIIISLLFWLSIQPGRSALSYQIHKGKYTYRRGKQRTV